MRRINMILYLIFSLYLYLFVIIYMYALFLQTVTLQAVSISLSASKMILCTTMVTQSVFSRTTTLHGIHKYNYSSYILIAVDLHSLTKTRKN